jgi:signal transduction histidine kinase
MIQNSPSIISLLICFGLEVIFGIIFFSFWIRYRSEKTQLYLSLWFFLALGYTSMRLMQFFAGINDAVLYSKASAIIHYLIIFVGWKFVNSYLQHKPGKIEKILIPVFIFIPVTIILFFEFYITNQVIIRKTIFNESFCSLLPGNLYLPFMVIRPLLLLFLALKLIFASQPVFRERIYIIVGFVTSVFISFNDALAVFFNLKWIRLHDFLYVPIGIMFIYVLIEQYFCIFNNLELLVEKRTLQLSEAVKSLQKEIRNREKSENELENYHKNLELKVEKRTKELNNAVHEYLAINEELQSTNEVLEDQRCQLENALKDLQKAKNQIVQSEKMAALGVLTAGIAHEINNPLNFIVGGIANLEKPLKNIKIELLNNTGYKPDTEFDEATNAYKQWEEIEELISFVITGSERITEIVKSLRYFSRSDQERIVETDIHDSINSALVMLQYQMKGKLKITKHYSHLPKIFTYPGKINQVFINILSNAIHAINDDGSIKIKTWLNEEDQTISISFKDNGKGIPLEIQDKIFEPFFTTKEAGTGLGLSIVYGILEQLEGKIYIDSEPNKGTEITITLPINSNPTTHD